MMSTEDNGDIVGAVEPMLAQASSEAAPPLLSSRAAMPPDLSSSLSQHPMSSTRRNRPWARLAKGRRARRKAQAAPRRLSHAQQEALSWHCFVRSSTPSCSSSSSSSSSSSLSASLAPVEAARADRTRERKKVRFVDEEEAEEQKQEEPNEEEKPERRRKRKRAIQRTSRKVKQKKKTTTKAQPPKKRSRLTSNAKALLSGLNKRSQRRSLLDYLSISCFSSASSSLGNKEEAQPKNDERRVIARTSCFNVLEQKKKKKQKEKEKEKEKEREEETLYELKGARLWLRPEDVECSAARSLLMKEATEGEEEAYVDTIELVLDKEEDLREQPSLVFLRSWKKGKATETWARVPLIASRSCFACHNCHATAAPPSSKELTSCFHSSQRLLDALTYLLFKGRDNSELSFSQEESELDESDVSQQHFLSDGRLRVSALLLTSDSTSSLLELRFYLPSMSFFLPTNDSQQHHEEVDKVFPTIPTPLFASMQALMGWAFPSQLGLARSFLTSNSSSSRWPFYHGELESARPIATAGAGESSEGDTDEEEREVEDAEVYSSSCSTSSCSSSCSSSSSSSPFDTMELYRAISPWRNRNKGNEKGKEKEDEIGFGFPPSSSSRLHLLLPSLRMYQKKAIEWMFQKEICYDTQNNDASENNFKKEDDEEALHPLWKRCQASIWKTSTENEITKGKEKEAQKEKGNQEVPFYYNQHSGQLSLMPFRMEWRRVAGGILADEMGLGKTVEVLALILAHPRKNDELEQHRKEKKSQQTLDEEKGHEGREKKSIMDPRNRQRRKEESEEDVMWCYCGQNSAKYDGVWVQCDVCKVWQHCRCVAFEPRRQQDAETTRRKKKRAKLNNEEEKKMKRRQKDITTSTKRERKGSKNRRREKKQAATTEGRTKEDKTKMEEEEYVCPECATKGPLLESRATLIVCPDSILHQWEQEIQKHTRQGALKVLTYIGVQGDVDPDVGGPPIVRPSQLVDWDIILTTYSVLRKDLHHAFGEEGSNARNKDFRYRKRYRAIPTPLLGVRFWRICLDEAQMVETTTTKAAEMALKLSTIYRWGVSGTPIQRHGLDDLYGLIQFLRVPPFATNKRAWRESLQLPFENGQQQDKLVLYRFLSGLMWRSNKEDVEKELSLPPLFHRVHFLRFSPVEAHFYRKTFSECSGQALSLLHRLKQDRERVGEIVESSVAYRKKLSRLFHSLLRLRQACCHPQVGSRSGFMSLQKNTMTMDELLQQLISRARLECADSQRNLVAALHGLAAIALIRNKPFDAISLYKHVLQMAFSSSSPSSLSENSKDKEPEGQPASSSSSSSSIDGREKEKEKGIGRALQCIEAGIVVDGLQLIHAVNNLADVMLQVEKYTRDEELKQLHMSFSGLLEGQTMDGTALKEEAKNLEAKYMEKPTNVFQNAVLEWRNAFHETNKYEDESENEEDQQKKETKKKKEERRKQKMEMESWWNEMLDQLLATEDQRLMAKFVEGIRNELFSEEERMLTMRESGAALLQSIAHRFANIHTLRFVIHSELQQIEETRKRAQLNLKALLSKPISEDDIDISGNCKVCRSSLGKLGQTCEQCKAAALLMQSENRIYRYRRTQQQSKESEEEKQRMEEELAIGSFREDSEVERVLKYLLRFMKNEFRLQHKIGEEETDGQGEEGSEKKEWRKWLSAGERHLERFGLLKKELKKSSVVVVEHRDYLGALHELACAKQRIRLRFDGEVVPLEESEIKVFPDQVEGLTLRFASMRMTAETELRIRTSQLKYLLKLWGDRLSKRSLSSQLQSTRSSSSSPSSTQSHQQQNEVPEVENEENECPICQEEIGKNVVVLTCGHTFCCACIMLILERAKHGTIKCPTCRTRMNASEVTYVSPQEGEKADNQKKEKEKETGEEQAKEGIQVEGSWGTKIEAVIRDIISTLRSSPPSSLPSSSSLSSSSSSSSAPSKCLVFSQWEDVLLLLSKALTANHIPHSRLRNNFSQQRNKNKRKRTASPKKSSFEETLDRFRFDSDVNVLLLPLKSGSNGLNLTEASHVFLVEPSLNVASELQAIGRVHRMGQTNERTFVHRYFIRDTIESRIHDLLSNEYQHQGQQKEEEERKMLSLEELDLLFAEEEEANEANERIEDEKEEIVEVKDTSQDGTMSAFLIRTPTKKRTTKSKNKKQNPNEDNNKEDYQSVFWNMLVRYNNRIMTKEEAATHIERTYSFELAQTGKRIVDEEHCIKWGRRICNEVWQRLVQLS
ncbi:SNF2 histone linker PHD RING helicase [Balamuthia mandrillaris]